jgi:hypothetical protein
MINNFSLNSSNFSFLFLITFSFSSYAQISFDKNNFKNSFVNKMDFDFSIKAYLSNNAKNPNDTIYEWEVVSLNQSNAWELQVCTDGVCIADPPINKTYPFILSIGDQEEFKIGWALFEESGNGQVKILVTSKNYPENKDTVSLEISTLSNIKNLYNNTLTVKPNPFIDFINVEFQDNSSKILIIYDILGNEVLTRKVFSGDRINTSGLIRGVYILKVRGSSDFYKIIHKN